MDIIEGQSYINNELLTVIIIDGVLQESDEE